MLIPSHFSLGWHWHGHAGGIGEGFDSDIRCVDRIVVIRPSDNFLGLTEESTSNMTKFDLTPIDLVSPTIEAVVLSGASSIVAQAVHAYSRKVSR